MIGQLTRMNWSCADVCATRIPTDVWTLNLVLVRCLACFDGKFVGARGPREGFRDEAGIGLGMFLCHHGFIPEVFVGSSCTHGFSIKTRQILHYVLTETGTPAWAEGLILRGPTWSMAERLASPGFCSAVVQEWLLINPIFSRRGIWLWGKHDEGSFQP